MKTITFTYRKKDNTVSDRTLLVMVSPGDKYAGIDLTSIDPDSAAQFCNEVEELHEAYLAQVQETQARYDLKHNYRQFFESGMSEIIEI
jgi:hypothetical protein